MWDFLATKTLFKVSISNERISLGLSFQGMDSNDLLPRIQHMFCPTFASQRYENNDLMFVIDENALFIELRGAILYCVIQLHTYHKCLVSHNTQYENDERVLGIIFD